MLFYKVKPEYDNKPRQKWSYNKHCYIPASVWKANELYTPSELSRNRFDATPEMFDEIRIKRTEIIRIERARFEKTEGSNNTTTNPPETDDAPENPRPLRVCERCLMAIESREGKQITRTIYLDDDDPTPCDWCEETFFDTLYELL